MHHCAAQFSKWRARFCISYGYLKDVITPLMFLHRKKTHGMDASSCHQHVQLVMDLFDCAPETAQRWWHNQVLGRKCWIRGFRYEYNP